MKNATRFSGWQGSSWTPTPARPRQNAADGLKAMGPGALSGLPAFVQVLNKQFLFSKEKCARALSLIGPEVIEAMWSLMPADQQAKANKKKLQAEAVAGLERLRAELSRLLWQ